MSESKESNDKDGVDENYFNRHFSFSHFAPANVTQPVGWLWVIGGATRGQC